jgi:hypothetical protein
MVKYKLATPVEFDGEIYEEIELTRPKGKHIRDLGDNQSIGSMIMVACKATGIPRKVFDEMDGYDYVKVGEYYNNFLEIGPKTGKRG